MGKEYFDMLLKLVGTLLGLVAIFQLYEVRKRRLVEMYWKIAEQYLSKEGHERRLALEKVEEWLAVQQKKNGKDPQRLVDAYKKQFHDAGSGTEEKQIDIKVRHHIRFLNQVGVLCRKWVVDRDLTFGLVGAGERMTRTAGLRSEASTCTPMSSASCGTSKTSERTPLSFIGMLDIRSWASFPTRMDLASRTS